MEKVLELYKYIDGVNDAKFPNDEEQVIVRDFRYDAKRMGGAPTISFSIKHSLCLDNLWDDNVYAMFNGERYYVKQTPTSSYSNEDTRYKHEVELISERTILDNVYFYDVVTTNVENEKPVSNSSKFSFFGDIHEYVKRVGYSLSWSGLDYTIEIDENIVSEEKQVSFENQVITSVLQEIYNIYQIPYYFDGKVIHVGYYQNNIDHVFKYGAQNSLLSISKTNANAKIINRITGVGSQDNIPYYYPNDDEKGVTRALFNGSTIGASIVNASKYRKVRLSDKFKFYNTIQTYVSLIDSSVYKLGDLRNDGTQDNKSKYSIDFYYSFTLNQQENIQISVTTEYADNVDLKFEVFKTSGQHIGYFAGDSSLSLTGGTYNLIVGWTFLSEIPMGGIYEYVPSLISQHLNISANIEVDSTETWTLKDVPVSLSDYGLSVSRQSNGDIISFERVSYIQPQPNLMPPIYRESLDVFYNALNNTYKDSNGDYYVFDNEYTPNNPKEYIENFDDIKPTIKNVVNANGERIDRFVEFAYDIEDNDETDENGNYLHPYFFAKLRKFNGSFGFNLFDHAIDESEMIVSMTSGSCGSCSFKVLVNKETQKNTVQVDEYGNLIRDNNGNVRFGSPQDRQNDTENYEVWIALEKDIQTFGVIMPNASNNYRPIAGDTYVILHIDLPKSYIESAEKRLENELIKYMYENNFEKFNFSISFSRIFFAEQPNILANLTENSKLNVEYNGNIYELYVSSLSYAMNSSNPLPEIRVELDDVIAISQNQISQIVASTKKEILAVSNQDVFWKDIKGVPLWITNEKPQYSYSELYGRPTKEDNDVWVLKTDERGNNYIFSIYPVVTQYGITMYGEGGDVNIPSIYAGLPIDGTTIYWDGGVLKAQGGGSGGAITDITSSMVVSALGYTPANASDLTALQSTVNDFLSDSDTDTIINKWKELEVLLSGLSESDNLATILGTKANKATTLAGYGITDAYTKSDVNTLLGDYVTLATAQTITGKKDFTTGGLFVNGKQIQYIPIDGDSGYWKLDGDLLVTGGITMFANEGTYTPTTIMDGLVLDSATLGINDEGQLYVKGGTGGGSIEGLATVATTGKYSDLIGVPTLLSSFTDDVVAGKYLPLSGGTLTSPLAAAVLTLKRAHNTGATWIDFYNNTGQLGAIGIGGSGSPVAGDIYFHNPTLSKDLKIWHEGNGGSGSGLDADTLDGLQPSSLSVLSATKLTTARTIWGQSFNGAGNVDGTITITNTAGVSTFIKSFVSDGTPYTTIGSNDYPIIIGHSNGNLSLWKGENNRQLSLRRSGSLVFTTTTQGGWAPSFGIIKNDGVESIGNICGALGGTNNLTYYYYGGTYDAPAMVITPSFNMGLGTTSPTAKLHVVGSIKVTTGISFARTYDGDFYNVIKSSGDRDFIISNLSGSGKIYVQTNYNSNTFDNLILTNNTATFGGKVGIGVSPTTMLSINQSAWDDGILLNRTVSGGGCGIKVHSNGTHIGTIGINGSKQLEVILNGISTLLMDSDGKMNFPAGTAGRKFVINPTSSYINCYATTSGGWTMGISYNSNSGTSFGSIGAYGEGGTFKYYFMGSYNGNRFQVDASGNGLFYGGVTMYSDIRKKTKLQDVELSLSQIANAPLIEHYYNSDDKRTTHVGSIAQYWAGLNDWFCKKDQEGFYTMEIQNAALASAISIARHLQKYETKTDRTIRKLKKRISELEDEVEKLKSA